MSPLENQVKGPLNALTHPPWLLLSLLHALTLSSPSASELEDCRQGSAALRPSSSDADGEGVMLVCLCAHAFLCVCARLNACVCRHVHLRILINVDVRATLCPSWCHDACHLHVCGEWFHSACTVSVIRSVRYDLFFSNMVSCQLPEYSFCA